MLQVARPDFLCRPFATNFSQGLIDRRRFVDQRSAGALRGQFPPYPFRHSGESDDDTALCSLVRQALDGLGARRVDNGTAEKSMIRLRCASPIRSSTVPMDAAAP